MRGALVALALVAVGDGAAAAPLTTPLELDAVRARLLAGDLVTFARAQAIRRARGEDLSVGPWAELDDLARLARCLPLGPVPAHEDPARAARRGVLRLERVRLQRFLRDGAHPGSEVAAYVGAPRVQTEAADQPELVRWPVEQERWPGERLDGRPAPTRCPARIDGARDTSAEGPARARARAAAERRAVAGLVPGLELLPDDSARKLAFAYLAFAEDAGPGFTPPLDWAAKLGRALRRGDGPEQTAGLLLLAQVYLQAEDPAPARAALDLVLRHPRRTDAEDAAARVLAVTGLSLGPPDVVRYASGARAPGPVARAVLDNAVARAHYAAGDRAALMAHGRAFLGRAQPEAPAPVGPYDGQTRDLLLRLALELPVPEALAWLDEVLPDAGELRRTEALAVGRWAVAAGAYEVAAALFDRLRVRAAARRAERGPRAARDVAQLVAARAEVAYETGDDAGFGGLLADLRARAEADRGVPLARFASHEAVARLGQALLGRLVNRAATDDAQARFAGHLLETVGALAADPSRWSKALRGLIAPLTTLAGPYAAGRAPPPRAEAKRKARPPKQLGEVVVRRLPPSLAPPPLRVPRPVVRVFATHPGPDGAPTPGLPWQD